MKRLLEVQKKLGTMVKDSTNPFFKSKYLDLTTILEHVTPLLNAEGLMLMQPLDNGDVCTSILDSETGALIAQSRIPLPPLTDPQKLGSAITYFRRYTLKSLLAIAEDDDDGNKASKAMSLPKLNQEEYSEVFANASLGILRIFLTKFDLTAEQKAGITKRGKELKENGTK